MPSTALFVLPTVMPAAGMAVVMAVMVTVYVGVKIQISGQICFHSVICHAGYAPVQLDSSLCQRHLRPSADSAADQDFHTCLCKKSR